MLMKILKRLLAIFAGSKALTTTSTSDSMSRTDTEFTAEVVQITQLLPHSNADKLEIARFGLKGIGETTYEVVVRKGEYQVGELAGYFSVDCLLPTSHPDFAFLKERPDGKDKALFRLRAARLRKVFSQGLLVKLKRPALEEYGRQLAEEYGVTYHRDPEPAATGPTAPSKPKPQVAPIYGVDSLKKVPNLFAANEPVFTTEKIHGTNFRFGWVRRKLFGIPFGYRFFVGSHRTERTPGKSTSYYGEDLYALAAERMGLAKLTRAHKGYVFYGELYGHTYDGKPIQPGWTYGRAMGDGPALVIFDVKDVTEGCWLPAWERADIVDTLGLKSPPILQAYDTINVCAWEGQKSVLDSGTIMEGIVVENLSGLRRKAKYVHQAYLEAQ